MQVRKATSNDLPVLERLLRECTDDVGAGLPPGWPHDRRLTILRLSLTDAAFHTFIADDASGPRGYGVLRLNEGPSSPTATGMIYEVFTFPSFRRQGVATSLLRAMIDYCQMAGYRTVRLMVNSDNAAAIALYRRIGFSERRKEMYLSLAAPL